ncbi:MAG: sugar O-acetyltransferase, partial [Spirochaetales bacterium]|nr:sugar O-acetyltransferase [Spirochaetales bacterium]
MNNVERRDNGKAYIVDEMVASEIIACRKLIQKLNTSDWTDFEQISHIIKELLGSSEGAFINPPFFCDYGKNIEVGKNFFANYNCTIIDASKVVFGDNCFLGPNVSIYTAGHPIYPTTRNSSYEFGKPVTIGDNVWIGGSVVICPGVNIG